MRCLISNCYHVTRRGASSKKTKHVSSSWFDYQICPCCAIELFPEKGYYRSPSCFVLIKEELAKLASKKEQPPNTDLICNLCNTKIGSYCMLSHDTSLVSMMQSSVIALRNHFRDVHGYLNPDPRFTMCTYCNKISEFDSDRKMWKGCNHTI